MNQWLSKSQHDGINWKFIQTTIQWKMKSGCSFIPKELDTCCEINLQTQSTKITGKHAYPSWIISCCGKLYSQEIKENPLEISSCAQDRKRKATIKVIYQSLHVTRPGLEYRSLLNIPALKYVLNSPDSTVIPWTHPQSSDAMGLTWIMNLGCRLSISLWNPAQFLACLMFTETFRVVSLHQFKIW